jgi:hypothetical protein
MYIVPSFAVQAELARIAAAEDTDAAADEDDEDEVEQSPDVSLFCFAFICTRTAPPAASAVTAAPSESKLKSS